MFTDPKFSVHLGNIRPRQGLGRLLEGISGFSFRPASTHFVLGCAFPFFFLFQREAALWGSAALHFPAEPGRVEQASRRAPHTSPLFPPNSFAILSLDCWPLFPPRLGQKFESCSTWESSSRTKGFGLVVFSAVARQGGERGCSLPSSGREGRRGRGDNSGDTGVAGAERRPLEVCLPGRNKLKLALASAALLTRLFLSRPGSGPAPWMNLKLDLLLALETGSRFESKVIFRLFYFYTFCTSFLQFFCSRVCSLSGPESVTGPPRTAPTSRMTQPAEASAARDRLFPYGFGVWTWTPASFFFLSCCVLVQCGDCSGSARFNWVSQFIVVFKVN